MRLVHEILTWPLKKVKYNIEFIEIRSYDSPTCVRLTWVETLTERLICVTLLHISPTLLCYLTFQTRSLVLGTYSFLHVVILSDNPRILS